MISSKDPLAKSAALATNSALSKIERDSLHDTNKLPDVIKLDEDFDYPENTGKPFYDMFTVKEREHNNFSTKLPNATPVFREKIVYLTFDDGPDPDNTLPILNILQQNQVKATFFVVGTQVEKHPEIVKRIFSEGHALGNHSYNHTYSDLYISPTAYLAQLEHTDEIIKQLVGVRTCISRAPGGTTNHFNEAFWRSIVQHGYVDISWNIVSGDASGYKAPKIIDYVEKQAEQKFLWNHAIVLMHDGRGHSETVKALPEIIAYFKRNGFEFGIVNLETPQAW